MGTHPSGPSVLAENGLAGTDLKRLLQQRPELLGAAALEFGADLPFMFKVLSVGTALSIQSHPDKALAKQLHRDQPEVSGIEAGVPGGSWGSARYRGGRGRSCDAWLRPQGCWEVLQHV